MESKTVDRQYGEIKVVSIKCQHGNLEIKKKEINKGSYSLYNEIYEYPFCATELMPYLNDGWRIISFNNDHTVFYFVLGR